MDESSKQRIEALRTTTAHLRAQIEALRAQPTPEAKAQAAEATEQLEVVTFDLVALHATLKLDTDDLLTATRERLAVAERAAVGDPRNRRLQTNCNQLWELHTQLQQDQQWLSERIPSF